jgi:hypothetical protein
MILKHLTALVVTGLLLVCAAPAWAMEHYTQVLFDNKGNAIKEATVAVYNTGTTTFATIYSDNGITLKANPFTTSSALASPGAYEFYAANGAYDIVFTKTGYTFTAALTRRITLFDVNDGGGGGGGTSEFADLLSGTNITAAMVVGSGASLNFTGTGSINASLFRGLSTLSIGVGGTGQTTAPDDTLLIGTGAGYGQVSLPACAIPTTSKLLYDSASNLLSCGVDRGGDFSTIGSGTNTTAAMAIGSGATLTFSGSGVINASAFHGNAIVGIADGGTGLTTAPDDALMLGNGSLFVLTSLPSCSNATTSKLLYDNTSNIFSCGTDQSAGGGTTFDTIGSGTNTTMAAVLGSGASLAVTGTGAVTATNFWPNVVTVNAGNSPYTALTTNATLLCDTSAAAQIINLPAATVKTVLTFVNVGSNTCTINRVGADTITTGLSVGLTSFVLRNAGSTFWLQPDGVSLWYVGG